jgi:hypothetical protein
MIFIAQLGGVSNERPTNACTVIIHLISYSVLYPTTALTQEIFKGRNMYVRSICREYFIYIRKLYA